RCVLGRCEAVGSFHCASGEVAGAGGAAGKAAGDHRLTGGAAGELFERGRRGESPTGRGADGSLREGSRGPAGRGDARSDAPAVSQGGVSTVAGAAAVVRHGWRAGSRIEWGWAGSVGAD